MWWGKEVFLTHAPANREPRRFAYISHAPELSKIQDTLCVPLCKVLLHPQSHSLSNVT